MPVKAKQAQILGVNSYKFTQQSLLAAPAKGLGVDFHFHFHFGLSLGLGLGQQILTRRFYLGWQLCAGCAKKHAQRRSRQLVLGSQSPTWEWLGGSC